MGAYLSQPVTDKFSTDETLEHFSYGASSMQGWRVSQEDAQNAIPDWDTNTSLFAVYDGHGGSEVAQYSAMYLPDFIKSTKVYKAGNLAQALEDAFLEFDEKLTKDEVIAELRQIAGITEQPPDSENEVDHLYAEANMPIEEVLAKYKSGYAIAHSNPNLKHLDESKPQSPYLRAKASEDKSNQDSSAISGDNEEAQKKTPLTDSAVNGEVAESTKESSGALTTNKSPKKNVNEDEKGRLKVDDGGGGSGKPQSTSSAEKGADNQSYSKETGDHEQAGSSKETSSRMLGKRTRKGPPKIVVEMDSDDEDDSSNEDEEVHYSDSSESPDEDGEPENEGKDDDDEEEEEEDDDSESEDDDDDDNNDDYGSISLCPSGREEPGYDSGCTAVVAVLRGNELYVANAGDSRCIVCRNGMAIEMSMDHKPETDIERKRIERAGGEVTKDGRVNGGLNLSRSIGDHTCKQNKSLPAKDQMISALPDIRTLTIDPEEDEFMVLACDGIWNYLSSQEVADFVRTRLNTPAGQEQKKLSVICEELFDHCLAPNTQGDGTGCDNMTAIIVKFHKTIGNLPVLKRKPDSNNGSPSSDDCNASKRARLDNAEQECA